MLQQINPADIRFGNEQLGLDEEQQERADRVQRYRQGQVRKAQMRVRCAALYASNMYLAQIAETVADEFDLEDPPDTKAIQKLITEQVDFWRKEGTKHVDDKKAMLLVRIDQIEELATNAYFASMNGKMTYNFEKQIDRIREQKKQDNKREAGLEIKKVKATNVLEQDLWDDIPELTGDEGLHTSGNLPNALVTMSEKIREYRRFEENAAGDPKFLNIMLDCVEKRAKLWGLYVKDVESDSPDREFARMSDKDRIDRMLNIIGTVQGRVIGGNTEATSQLASPAPLARSISDEKKHLQDELAREAEQETNSRSGIGLLRGRVEDTK